MSGIRVFNSAIRQLQQSQQNLAKVRMAREKNNRDNELFDLKKKQAESKLQEQKLETQMTEVDYEFQKTQLDEYFKQQKKIKEGQTAQINQTEALETNKMQTAQNVSKDLLKRDPRVQDYAYSILEPVTAGGHVMGFKKPKKEKVKDTENYQLFEMANKMAADDLDRDTTYEEKIQKYIPEAKKILYAPDDKTRAVLREHAESAFHRTLDRLGKTKNNKKIK